MVYWRRLLLVLICGIAISTSVLAEDALILDIKGRVNDHAHVISDHQRRQIHQILSQHKFISGQFVVLVTVPDLGAVEKNKATESLWRQWKYKDKAHSVMLVLYKAQKSADVLAGDGLKAKLGNDAIQRVLNILSSDLQGGDYDAAAMDGVKAIIGELGS